jgi:ABC-2 type transport system permease protein
MHAIFTREVKAYFYSPIAYILIGLFMLLTSVFFTQNLTYQSGEFSGNLSTMGFILIFIVPILTMKILAEDRKNGTEVLLVTSPVSLTAIVVGKYLATLFVLLVMTVLSFIYPVILVIFGSHITAQLLGAYLGFFLLGASLLSVGIFASSLTENQVVAAVIGFVSLLLMWVIDPLSKSVGGILARF